MASIIKKIFIAVIILAAGIFLNDQIIPKNDKQAKRSSAIIKSSALAQHKTVLADKQPVLSESKLLDVPLINQLDAPRLYNGCEITSLAMILNYNGYSVTKNKLAEKIKTVPLSYKNGLKGNPNEGFVGDMDDGPGYAVYNGPIYDLAKIYAGEKVVNLTNGPFTDLLKEVNDGQPVWVITTTSFAPVSNFQNWTTPQGTIKITFSEHSVVITGYDEDFIYVNDPYGDKNKKLDRDNFEKAWEQMGSQAIVIHDQTANV